MRRRTNPWPAFADLFAALLVVSFGALILLSSKANETNNIRKIADKAMNDAKQQLAGATVRNCGDDTCIDLDIKFELNSDKIQNEEQVASLKKIGGILKQALDSFPKEDRKALTLVIEGHTDSTQAKFMKDERERDLYNWSLSSKRANSVAYVFMTSCKIDPSEYQVEVIGYADSKPPDCEFLSPKDCDAKKRRTTLVLRADTREIEKRMVKLNPNG